QLESDGAWASPLWVAGRRYGAHQTNLSSRRVGFGPVEKSWACRGTRGAGCFQRRGGSSIPSAAWRPGGARAHSFAPPPQGGFALLEDEKVKKRFVIPTRRGLCRKSAVRVHPPNRWTPQP